MCQDMCQDDCEAGNDEIIQECEDECEDTGVACEQYCKGDTSCEEHCEENTDIEGEAIDACKENCDNDDGVDSCITECERDCSNESTRQYYISATDEFVALYDINGDGLPDMVNSESMPWQVYLNTGTDLMAPLDWDAPTPYSRRSYEGRPTIKWEYVLDGEESSEKVSGSETGKPSSVFQALIDVDGDGLLDLVMGKTLGDKFYRNTGSGFAATAKSLPAWWPDSFMTGDATTDVDANSGETSGSNSVIGIVMDFNHDGMLDSVTTKQVQYGAYPRPYLLEEVKNGQGGKTEIAYRSLATVSPSGDWSKPQYTPNIKHLADVITSVDGWTGQSAETSFTYADGYYADGVFQGFKSRGVAREFNGTWTSRTDLDYELDDDREPLVTKQSLYTDGNLSFGSVLKRGTAVAEKLRLDIETSYGDSGAVNQFRLPQKRKITEYGEKNGSATTTLKFNYDPYGNMTSYSHDGGGNSADAVVVTMAYAANNADLDSATFFRMKKKSTAGTDPLTGAYQYVASEKYYYDDNTSIDDALTDGLLTRTDTSAGWLGNGETLDKETLTVTYTRGNRGELTSATDLATGITMAQVFGFGGAVLKTQTNGLGHILTRAIDAQGRVTKITDPNGMAINLTYDAFNRVIKKTVTGSDDKSYTYKTNDYQRSSKPYYTTTEFYNDDGSVDVTGYAVEDGFGNSAKNWAMNMDGDYLVTTSINDLRELTTATGHPENNGTTFTAPMTSIGIANAFGKSYYDALGNPREVIRDATAATGSQLVYRDKPRQELRQDEEGYQTELTYDAHGRVIKVRQGKGGTLSKTAEYARRNCGCQRLQLELPLQRLGTDGGDDGLDRA